MASSYVTAGIYRFFTLPELDAERVRYKAEVQKANTQLAGAGINGQSFTFAVNGREMSLEEWANALAHAYQQLGHTAFGEATSPVTVSRF